MPIPSPPADGRTLDEVAKATETLAEAYSGWKPPPAGSPDMGSALIRVFARMAKHVIDRVDRVPDRSFLAFLNLIGVEPQPPLAAGVPLTFSLAKGSAVEPLVPRGTRVGADPAEGDPREVVFETDRDLVVARSKLVAVLVRQPPFLVSDRTTEAGGAVQGDRHYDVFAGHQPMEHTLHLAAEDVLSLRAGTPIALRIDATNPSAWHALATHWIEWTYWNGQAWSPLAHQISAGPPWSLAFALPSDIAATAVNGQIARWIRARLADGPGIPLARIQAVSFTASTNRSGIAPDKALSGGRPIDLSMDYHPLGERPKFNDTFHIASGEALSLPGATVTVTVTPSAVMAKTLKDTDNPKIVWEAWTGSAWENVLTTVPTAVPGTIHNDAIRTVTFTLPAQVAPTAVGGSKGHWLRVRLASGDFGKGFTIGTQNNAAIMIDDGYRPPILESIALGVSHAITSSAVVCVTGDERGFTDHTGEPSFDPFVRADDTRPELYLGFDRPFPARPALLYIQVAPARVDASAEVDTRWEVVWEYSTQGGFAPLGAVDGTGGFVRSGLVEFVGPMDFAPRIALGRSLHWIRARLSKGDVQRRPRAGLVLTNTVLASHTTTVAGEILGSSDQSARQTFTPSQTPVLAGQRIEVTEPEVPPLAERAEIERVEGEDAVTMIPGEGGRPGEVRVRWHEVPDFHGSGPRDRHYRIDRATGAVMFGDGLHGMTPPRGSGNIRADYRAGGGAHGNRPAGAVHLLKTTIPYVDSVTSLEDASGGADAESLERTKERGPRTLRHGGRAVTGEDFEDLAKEASPEVARVRAISPHFEPAQQAENPGHPPVPDAGVVTLLIVPNSAARPPEPSRGLLSDVEAFIRARCTPSVALRLASPTWIRATVGLQIVPVSFDGSDALRGTVERALQRFFDPFTGGFDGAGWALGEVPHASDVHRLVSAIRGVDAIRGLEFSIDPPDPPPSEDALVYGVLVHHIQILAPAGGG